MSVPVSLSSTSSKKKRVTTITTSQSPTSLSTTSPGPASPRTTTTKEDSDKSQLLYGVNITVNLLSLHVPIATDGDIIYYAWRVRAVNGVPETGTGGAYPLVNNKIVWTADQAVIKFKTNVFYDTQRNHWKKHNLRLGFFLQKAKSKSEHHQELQLNPLPDDKKIGEVRVNLSRFVSKDSLQSKFDNITGALVVGSDTNNNTNIILTYDLSSDRSSEGVPSQRVRRSTTTPRGGTGQTTGQTGQITGQQEEQEDEEDEEEELGGFWKLPPFISALVGGDRPKLARAVSRKGSNPAIPVIIDNNSTSTNTTNTNTSDDNTKMLSPRRVIPDEKPITPPATPSDQSSASGNSTILSQFQTLLQQERQERQQEVKTAVQEAFSQHGIQTILQQISQQISQQLLHQPQQQQQQGQQQGGHNSAELQSLKKENEILNSKVKSLQEKEQHQAEQQNHLVESLRTEFQQNFQVILQKITEQSDIQQKKFESIISEKEKYRVEAEKLLEEKNSLLEKNSTLTEELEQLKQSQQEQEQEQQQEEPLTTPRKFSGNFNSPSSLYLNNSTSSSSQSPALSPSSSSSSSLSSSLPSTPGKDLKPIEITAMSVYLPRLLRLSGNAQDHSVTLMPLSPSSLNQTDIFFLETEKTLYQWTWGGKNHKNLPKGPNFLKALKPNHVDIISDLWENKEEARQFWLHLGITDIKQRPAKNSTKKKANPEEDFKPQIFVFPNFETPIAQGSKNLKATLFANRPNDIMLVDSGFDILIWLGKGVTKDRSVDIDEYLGKWQNDRKNIQISKMPEGAKHGPIEFFFYQI